MTVSPARAFRVYFHERRNAPQVWSVDEGTPESEIHVAHVVVGEGLEVFTGYLNSAASDEPCAWLTVCGARLSIRNGTAYLEKI